MRLSVLDQFTKGLHHTDPEASQTIAKDLVSAKWYLWHGNVEQALPLIEDCYLLCDDPDIGYEKRKKFGKHLAEMVTYIGNNAHLIPNYGEKYRYGETITTSFAESAVNEIVAKRMFKSSKCNGHPLERTIYCRQERRFLMASCEDILSNDTRR